jgi:hypothetical protein
VLPRCYPPTRPPLYPFAVSVPETIPVRYSEEDAEYVSVRPVRRQTFRFDELIDMVLSVTGKDPARIQKILRTGTVVFHFYRYWWESLEVSAEELAGALARYPDADPCRAFRAEDCAAILLESAGSPPRHSTELDRKTTGRRRLFRARSFWDALLELTRAAPPEYGGYSYSRRADLYRLAISQEQAAALFAEAERLAPRNLRARLVHLREAARILCVCPRSQ